MMKYAILILLAALVPRTAHAQWSEPFVYDVADLIDGTKCTDYGCELDTVLTDIIAACETEVIAAGSWREATGCKIKIPAGDHTLDTTFEFCRAYSIEGAGGTANRRPLTRIFTSKDVFVGRGFGDCRATGEGHGGAITVKDLGFYNLPPENGPPIVGMRFAAPPRIENVWMTYFDVSLIIEADVNNTPASNANVFYIDQFTTEYSNHTGILIEGGDTNAGALIGLNVNTACMNVTPETIAEFGECAGLLDSSFLGNVVVASHFGIAAGYPDFIFDGASNRGTCLGCYVEGLDAPKLSPWSQWIGGLGPRPDGVGFRLDGPRASALIIENDLDPSNVVSMEMGRSGNLGGTYYTLRHNGAGSGWPLRQAWNPATDSYVEYLANTAIGSVRSILGVHTGNPHDLGQTIRHDDVTPCDPNSCCAN